MPPRGWIDPDKLIGAATELAAHHAGAGRPNHTMLRRSVSTAYYALFHCLLLDAGNALLPNGTDQERLAVMRQVRHSDLKQCCQWIAGRLNPPVYATPLVNSLKSTVMAAVAGSFIDLQEARHLADYDHTATFSKATAVAHVQDAKRSISDVGRAPPDVREAFATLVALKAKG